MDETQLDFQTFCKTETDGWERSITSFVSKEIKKKVKIKKVIFRFALDSCE